MTLTDFQRAALDDRSRCVAVVCGRRTGKTTMIAQDAAYHLRTNPRQTGLILCTSHSTKENMVAALIKELSGVSEVIVHNMDTFKFENESRLMIRTAEALDRSMCGTQLDKIWVEDPDSIPNFSAKLPQLMICLKMDYPLGTILIAGTPFYTDDRPSIFRELMIRNFSMHLLPSWLSPHWTPELEKHLKKDAGAAFAQEFLGAF